MQSVPAETPGWRMAWNRAEQCTRVQGRRARVRRAHSVNGGWWVHWWVEDTE